MPEGFVALAERLRPAPVPEPAQPHDVAPAPEPDLVCEVIAELQLARLAALEAYDRAVPTLLKALADDVLGRELTLAPADVASLAADLRARFAREGPVAVVVAPSEALERSCALRIRRDPTLGAGDLILEVHDGEVDASFALRLSRSVASAVRS